MDEGLPRPPGDSGNLDRLRDEALERVKREERSAPLTVYGAPPIPVYGGPPPRKRAWWRVLIIALIGIAAAILAWMLTHPSPINPAPVYGGPPPQPVPQHSAVLVLALRRLENKLRQLR